MARSFEAYHVVALPASSPRRKHGQCRRPGVLTRRRRQRLVLLAARTDETSLAGIDSEARSSTTSRPRHRSFVHRSWRVPIILVDQRCEERRPCSRRKEILDASALWLGGRAMVGRKQQTSTRPTTEGSSHLLLAPRISSIAHPAEQFSVSPGNQIRWGPRCPLPTSNALREDPLTVGTPIT